MLTSSRKAGFTLTEALIALFILTMSLGGSLALMTWLIRANAFSTRITSAVTQAQAKVDELAATKYDDVQSGSDADSIYQRTWTVTEASTRKTINVIVNWVDQDGNTRQVALNTMVDDRL